MNDIPTRCPECKLMPEDVEEFADQLYATVYDKQYIGLTAQEARELRARLLDELRVFFSVLVR